MNNNKYILWDWNGTLLNIENPVLISKKKALPIWRMILSAMEQKSLIEHTRLYKINHYFDRIIGLDNIHAGSKIEKARALIERQKINTDQCLVIGDTYHDYEVAVRLGVKCILVNNGHQEPGNYTFDSSVLIVDQISDLPEIF